MYNPSVLPNKSPISIGCNLIPLIPFQLQKRGIKPPDCPIKQPAIPQEENELIRQIVQVCAACKHGRTRMVCRRNQSQCHNRQIRKWLKQIQEINNKKEELCTVSKTDS